MGMFSIDENEKYLRLEGIVRKIEKVMSEDGEESDKLEHIQDILTENQEIEPCPYCGNSGIHIERFFNDNGNQCYKIYCFDCGLTLESGDVDGKSLVKYWNRMKKDWK